MFPGAGPRRSRPTSTCAAQNPGAECQSREQEEPTIEEERAIFLRRTAGFLQKSNSFCAVASCCASTWTPPVAAAFASSLDEVVVKPDSLVGDAGSEPVWLDAAVVPWVMPVLRSTSAIDAMQHRFGSRARYPHESSRSKPLQERDRICEPSDSEEEHRPLEKANNVPHAEHVDQVLLGNVVVAADVSLQRRKDAPVLEQGVAAVNLELRQGRVRLAQLVSGGVSRVVAWRGPRCGCGCRLFSRRRDGKVLELLSQDDDGLLEEERVLHVGLGERRAERQVSTGTLVARSAIKGVAGSREKVEDKVEALGVEL